MKDRISNIGISGIRSFTSLCAEIDDMLFLTIGEPDLDTPKEIKEAAKKALDNNETHYPPALGITPLRKRIAKHESELFDYKVDHEQVIITSGATEALVLTMWSILNEGDNIVIPSPGYPMYKSMIALANAEVISLETEEDNFQIDETKLRACITDKTQAILLTSPNNPTGQVLNRKSILAVKKIMEEHPNLYCILDDVYNTFIYEGEVASLREYAELRERLIIVQAFSKSHAMTGWRIGYVVASTNLIDRMHKLHQNLVTGVSTMTQVAAIKAFDVDTTYMKEDYKERRDYVYKRLIDMGFDVLKPEGAFYIFPSIKKFKMGSYDFALKCAQEAKVALIPGIYFGSDDYIRISYCYSKEVLQEALDRLEVFVESL